MDQSDDMAIAQPLGINVRVSNSSLWSKKKRSKCRYYALRSPLTVDWADKNSKLNMREIIMYVPET